MGHYLSMGHNVSMGHYSRKYDNTITVWVPTVCGNLLLAKIATRTN